MDVTASQLRQDIYRLLDRVLETGEPLEIERKGHRLRVVAVDAPGRLDRIRGNPNAVVGNPEDLVEIDWVQYWDAASALEP